MIPIELTQQQRWVVAKHEERHGKMTKVPYRPSDPTHRASSIDPSTWGSYDQAVRLVQRGGFPMLGFMFERSGYVGIDLDDCRDLDTAAIEDWARGIVQVIDSYTEVSVSGTGLHIIARGRLPPGGRRRDKVEMYNSGRYFVVTGVVIRERGIEERTSQLAALHARLFDVAAQDSRPDYVGNTRRGLEEMPERRSTADLTDDDLLDRVRSSQQATKFQRLWAGDVSEYASHSEADCALCTILAFWTQQDAERINRLFRLSGLYRRKWERRDYRERTVRRAIDRATDVYDPVVDLPDVDLESDASTPCPDLDDIRIEEF